MCKYCEKVTKTTLIQGKENGVDVILNGNDLILDAYRYVQYPLIDNIEFDINYCPVCGRYLRKPTEK